MKHILYANNDWDAAQNALNAGTLENPYIAGIEWYSGISIDYNTLEQQSCAQRGLCGDDPTNCHECTCEESYSDPASICDCEGGYYWGDECHDEPEPDPCAEYESQEECECVQQGGTWEGSECVMPSDDPCDGDPECECNNTDGYHFWEDNTCHDCVEEWEELGYSSPEDCACDKRGEDSGVCPEPDPCAGMEQDISDCGDRGGTWDYANCFCIEPEDQPCGGDPECECIMQGGEWDGETCIMPDPDPCAEYIGTEEYDICECEQQGGTWSGSECQMPSDE